MSSDSPTDEEFADALRMMYTTDGWQYFLDELELNCRGLNNLANCSDEKSLYYNKGQLDALTNIINMQETMELSETFAAEEDAADEEEELVSVH